MDAQQAAARIREALEAGPTPGPWLYRGKSNSFHKPPPEGTQYVYGDFILTVGSDYDDEKPETQANIDYIAACSPDSLRALLAERDELAKDAARYRWLRNEAWGGGVARHKFPHVVEYRPGLMPTAVLELAEEALDAAIDAALTHKD